MNTLKSLLQKKVVLRGKATFQRTYSAGPMASEATLPALREVEVQQTELTTAEAADIRRDPEVIAVADAMPLKLIEPVGPAEPNPTALQTTWGIEAIGADSSGFDGSGAVVAILDTGINPTHDAFQGVSLERRNFTPSHDDDDKNGHGTHVAGTVLGRDVNGLRLGVARGVDRALIAKVLSPDGGTTADLADAITWAYRQGANVISMSLGYDYPGYVDYLVHRKGLDIEPATSMALEQYRANVDLFGSLSLFLNKSEEFSQATVMIAASGNESNRPRYEIAAAPPSAGDGLISVGAVQRSGAGNLSVANFSNTQCNVSGPGVSVTSAWIGGDSALKTINGTSMATPHVAGCAAMWYQFLKQQFGVVTSESLAARLLATCSAIPGSAFEDVGNGLIQAPGV